MKFVIFQGVNGQVATLEGLLEVEADRHICLGNLIAYNLRDYRNFESSLKCLDLARKQLEINADSGKDLKLLRGHNEDIYLEVRRKSRGSKAYPQLGDANSAFVHSFYLRLQRPEGRLVFLPWFGKSTGVSVSDPAGLNHKTKNEKKLHLLTADDVAQHYGDSMYMRMDSLFPTFGEHFIHFIGKWRMAMLWEIRAGRALPKIIPPDKYEDSASFRSANYVLEEDRKTVVFPGAADNGYYCTYDTDSRELVIVHDRTLSY